MTPLAQVAARIELAAAMPVLSTAGYKVVLPKSTRYNCFSWAAGDTTRWWVPPAAGRGYWPPDLPTTDSLDNFIAAFETCGYGTTCANNPALEAETEKIALYMHGGARGCSHAARQHPTGVWTSKIGRLHVIAHRSPNDLAGNRGHGYGQVVAYMARPTAQRDACRTSVENCPQHRPGRA